MCLTVKCAERHAHKEKRGKFLSSDCGNLRGVFIKKKIENNKMASYTVSKNKTKQKRKCG